MATTTIQSALSLFHFLLTSLSFLCKVGSETYRLPPQTNLLNASEKQSTIRLISLLVNRCRFVTLRRRTNTAERIVIHSNLITSLTFCISSKYQASNTAANCTYPHSITVPFVTQFVAHFQGWMALGESFVPVFAKFHAVTRRAILARRCDRGCFVEIS